MSNRIVVVDYGVGNLFSVRRAIEVSGGEDIVLSADPDEIAGADRVILPGVGAFEDGMRGLGERGLVEPLKSFAHSGRPLLGICLGMQMLASQSEEFGLHDGLDLIPGRVVAIPRQTTDGGVLKVPSIGWTLITSSNRLAVDASCLAGHADHSAVYLVHSFHVVPTNPEHLLASYDFGGHAITAAIGRGNVIGLQFHPEKSGKVGLDIMRRFIAGS